MATTPSLTFPDSLNINERIRGGTVYGQSASIAYGELGEVISIDCSSLDNSHTENNPLVLDVVTFSNGRKMRLKLYNSTVQFGQQSVPCVEVYLINDSGTQIKKNSYSFVSGHAMISNPNAVRTYGVKVIFMTHYVSAQAGSTSDEFRIYLFTPGTDPVGDSILTGLNLVNKSKLMFECSDVSMYGIYTSLTGLAYGISLDYAQLGANWSGCYYSFTNMDTFNSNFFGLPSGSYKTINPEDPTQDQEDPSGPGGGDGNFDKTSDPIDFPSAPTGGALSSGAIKAFEVTSANLTDLFTKLWDTAIFDPSNWQKLLNDPLDALIQLSCLPLSPTLAGNQYIKLGNWDSQIQAPVIASQYVTVDCGSYKLSEFWGSALDYNPYTKIQVYLPFIGIRDLDTDDCMKATLHIKYIIDILSGDLTAQIKCGQSVLYKFQGNCRAIIPVSMQVNDAIIQLVKGATNVAMGAAAGNAAGAIAGAISTAVNTALAKTTISRTGDLSGSVGLLDDFTPYLIIHRPIQSIAQNFKDFKGYPSNITATLSSLSGFTEIEYIHLEGIDGATDTELQEIEDLLKKGVII